MALVSVGWFLEVSLMDNGGDVTTKRYQLTAVDAAAAAADSATILAALAGVTDAEITGYYAYDKFAEDTPSFPGAGVQIENIALLEFDIDGNPLKKATHTIPAPKQDIFVGTTGPNANIVDLSDAAVVAYRSMFQQNGQALISDGEEANVLIKGRRIHRKSRRG